MAARIPKAAEAPAGRLFHWELSMSAKSRRAHPQPRQPVLAASRQAILALFGPGGDGKPRGGRFPPLQVPQALKAAQEQHVPFLWIDGPQAQALVGELPEGRIDAKGRGTLPPIPSALLERLAALHASQQAKAAAAAFPRNWTEIGVGSLVLATDDAEPQYGWWEAFVVDTGPETLTLIWRDDPEWGVFTQPRLNVALLDPAAHVTAQPTSGMEAAPQTDVPSA